MKGLQENQIIHDEILYEYNMEKKGKLTIVIFNSGIDGKMLERLVTSDEDEVHFAEQRDLQLALKLI